MAKLPDSIHEANVWGKSQANNEPSIAELQKRYISALKERNERLALLFGAVLREQLEIKQYNENKKRKDNGFNK